MSEKRNLLLNIKMVQTDRQTPEQRRSSYFISHLIASNKHRLLTLRQICQSVVSTATVHSLTMCSVSAATVHSLTMCSVSTATVHSLTMFSVRVTHCSYLDSPVFLSASSILISQYFATTHYTSVTTSTDGT
jgi:hypothetical protein